MLIIGILFLSCWIIGSKLFVLVGLLGLGERVINVFLVVKVFWIKFFKG